MAFKPPLHQSGRVVVLLRGPGRPTVLLSYSYSPECVEGEFCEVGLPIYGVLRSSPNPHSRKSGKNSLHNSSLMASMRLLCNEQGGASLRVPPSWEGGFWL